MNLAQKMKQKADKSVSKSEKHAREVTFPKIIEDIEKLAEQGHTSLDFFDWFRKNKVDFAERYVLKTLLESEGFSVGVELLTTYVKWENA